MVVILSIIWKCVCFSRFYRIYAIGDAVHGPMLAHKAEDEGMEYKWREKKLFKKMFHIYYTRSHRSFFHWPLIYHPINFVCRYLR